MNIDKKIIEIRKNNNLTQEEFAEKLNVSRQTVSNWENGKCYPDIETLIIISNKFNISLDHLLKDNIVMVKEIDKKVKWSRKLIYTASILLFFLIISGGIIYYKNNKVVEVTNENEKLEEKLKTIINIPDHTSIFAFHKNIDVKELAIGENISIYIADNDSNLLYNKPLATNIEVICFENHEHDLINDIEIEDIESIIVKVPNVLVPVLAKTNVLDMKLILKESENDTTIIEQEAIDIINNMAIKKSSKR